MTTNLQLQVISDLDSMTDLCGVMTNLLHSSGVESDVKPQINLHSSVKMEPSKL